MLNGVVVLKAQVPFLSPADDGNSIKTEQGTLTAIPYYTWANRGRSQMDVWLPTKISSIEVKANKDDK
jgi:hypothetical protein